MHVLLVPLGSHGDVHPFIGLGMALRSRGHRATLVTNQHFERMARRAGLEFVSVGSEADFLRVTENPDLWKPMKGFRFIMRSLTELIRPVYDAIALLNVPGETVIASQVTAWGARIAQEKLGIPLVTVDLQPALFLSLIDPPAVPLSGVLRAMPMWLRKALKNVAPRYLTDHLMAPAINKFRRELGLPPVHTIANWWHSPHCILGLFPDWFAPPQADWPPNVHLTGFPLFDEAEHVELSGAVEQFLNAGTPPIVFTAGSAMRHGHDFFSAAADACVRLDKRGILLARFSEQIPTGLPTTVRHFDYVPFSLLLRRAAALVHHGGIGTTAQALAAGLPQLIMPLAHDQPDNAMRLKRLGVGESLTRGKFKGPAVAQRLRALLSDPDLPARCRVLADRINRDHALARSCEVIEGLLADAPRPSPVS